LKPERWGSAVIRKEKGQGERACDKRIIIVIVIIIIIN
jgi:hypothetical protein